MSSSKNDKNNAPQGASGDSPRPGLRPGTRAWARANPTADDPAAALPEAEPDHHLQDAGGDVAGAEEDTAVGTAPDDQQKCNRGDDADAEASQARSAQRLADWLADCNDDESWNHAAQAFSRRGIRLMRAPTQSALAEGSMAADLEGSATGADFHSSQNGSSDSESDSGRGAAPWARHTRDTATHGTDDHGSVTPSGLPFGPKVPRTHSGGVAWPLDPRVDEPAPHHLPGYVESALTRERTQANIHMRLTYVGAQDTAAVIQHRLLTDRTMLHLRFPQSMARHLSRVEWTSDNVGLDKVFGVVTAEDCASAGASLGSPIRVDGTAVISTPSEVLSAFMQLGDALQVISPSFSRSYLGFAHALARDPTLRSVGRAGVRGLVRILDEQLSVVASSAAAWASYVVSAPPGARATSDKRAPKAPRGLLDPTSRYTADMIQRCLVHAITSPALPAHALDRSGDAASGAGPRAKNGTRKCPEFAP